MGEPKPTYDEDDMETEGGDTATKSAGSDDAGGTVAGKRLHPRLNVACGVTAEDEANAVATPLPDSDDEMQMASNEKENAESETENMEETPP